MGETCVKFPRGIAFSALMITRAPVRANVVKSKDARRNIRANAIDYSLLPIITPRLKALDRLAPLDTTPADAFPKCSLPVNLLLIGSGLNYPRIMAKS